MQRTVERVVDYRLDDKIQKAIVRTHKHLQWKIPAPNMPSYEGALEAYRKDGWKHWEKKLSADATGKWSMTYECIDLHCQTERKNKVALHYVGDTGTLKFTFDDLRKLTNKCANMLRECDVQKGDPVFVFIPNKLPELYISMLGIPKMGGVACPLFEAFKEDALRDRLQDAKARTIITTTQLGMEDRIPFRMLPDLENVILIDDPGRPLRDYEHSWKHEMANAPSETKIEWMDRDDPLNILYTSGSTGRPKGVETKHGTAVGLLATSFLSLDLKDTDTYHCSADPGWVTGTNYGIYGPWLLGASTVVSGGRFEVDKFYRMIQDNGVTVVYTAPTVYRKLMEAGVETARRYDLSAVRLYKSVGEPLQPAVLTWGLEALGKTIEENWWMTECGMHIVGNYPCMTVKLGSMGKAFPGIEVAIIDEKGKPLPPYTLGHLAVKRGWPSEMKTIHNDPVKYKSYYKGENCEWYDSGDLAYMDGDGYVFYQGRDDDIIKTNGERVGPAEVESTLMEHPAVKEAGVIGVPDFERGQAIMAYISLRKGHVPKEGHEDELKKEIMDFVGNHLAAHEKPRIIEFIDKLPITRSGKIRRRDLRARFAGLPLGDTSTLDDD